MLERMFLHVLLRSLAGGRRLRAEGGAWGQGMLEAAGHAGRVAALVVETGLAFTAAGAG